MQEPITISRATPDQPSMDYALLRERGLDIIRNLSSNLWTDYNIHDPGVTILEQLAYAITELGYRADLDIKDILMPAPDSGVSISRDLFTPAQILSNAAVTIQDYRKIIIDVPGVRNAFFDLLERGEVPVYIDRDGDKLSYEPTAEELPVKGLYQVTLELASDDEYGDLNRNTITKEVVVTGVNLDISFSLPNWFVIDKRFREEFTIIGNPVATQLSNRDEVYNYEVAIAIDGGGTAVVEVEAQVLTSLLGLNIGSTGIDVAIRQVLNTPGFWQFFNKKITKIWGIVDTVKKRLQSSRNMCEDFFSFKNLEIEEVSLCSYIEVESGVDVSDILGEIYFRLDQFLAPRTRFYSLGEMFEKGKRVEEIFRGPVLDRGFIDDAEFASLKDIGVIRTSDLINIIMDIDGIVGMDHLELSSYVNNDLIASQVENTLAQSFPETHKLRLSIDRSKILFFRDEDPRNPGVNYILANKTRVTQKIAELESLVPTLTAAAGSRDLDVPVGEYGNLEEYFSIQEDFPLTYGISSAGIKTVNGDTAALNLRKAQARQLKAYLLFAEQLMANFYAQLANVRELFSFNTTVKRTYFTHPIFEVPEVALIIKDFVDGLPAGFNLEDSQAVQNKFNQYIVAPNDFSTDLNSFAESEKVYKERRARFLKHLLARFSEDFSAYASKMFEIYGAASNDRIVEDQINFLKKIDKLSAERFRSFNQKDPANVWDTDNVPGYTKRVAAKLGITNSNRRSLYFNYDDRTSDVLDCFTLTPHSFTTKGELVDSAISGLNYASGAERDQAISDLIVFGYDACNYCRKEAYTDITGITKPGTVALNGTSALKWTNANNALVADGIFAESVALGNNQISDYLVVKSFGFSAIPSNAVITGIKVSITRKRDANSGVGYGGDLVDGEVKLLVGVIKGDNKADKDTVWTDTAQTVIYGGQEDKWGVDLNPSLLNSVDFGVAIRVQKKDALLTKGYIDYIDMTVYYADEEDVFYTYRIKKNLSVDDQQTMCGATSTVSEVAVAYPQFTHVADRDNAINSLSRILFNKYWQEEGLHVIEHILLRPKVNNIEVPIANPAAFSNKSGQFNYYKSVWVKSSDTTSLQLEGLLIMTDFTVGDTIRLVNSNNARIETTILAIEPYLGDTRLRISTTIGAGTSILEIEYLETVNYVSDTVTNKPVRFTVPNANLYYEIAEGDTLEILTPIGLKGTYPIKTVLADVPSVGKTSVEFDSKITFVQDALFPVSLEEEENCACPVITDGYSFRATIILPAWTERFNKNSFRKLVEQTLRFEAPAHVYIRVIWANIPQMLAFETAYKEWLVQNAKDEELAIIGEDLSHAQSNLLNTIISLNSQSTSAILEDITEKDDGGEVLVLGNTILG